MIILFSINRENRLLLPPPHRQRFGRLGLSNIKIFGKLVLYDSLSLSLVRGRKNMENRQTDREKEKQREIVVVVVNVVVLLVFS